MALALSLRSRNNVAMRLAPVTAVTAAVLLLTGCAVPHSLTDPAPSGVPTSTVTETIGQPSGNYFVVRAGDTELHLEPLTVGVEDPRFPTTYPAVRGDDLFVFVRPAGWPLFAQQYTGAPLACDERTYALVTDDLGGGWWRVSPIGPAGSYTVTLDAGSGPGLPLGGETGGMASVLTVETSIDRPFPGPHASLDFPLIDGVGSDIVLFVTGLSDTPTEASASLTVTGEGAPWQTDLPVWESACPDAGEVSFLARVDAGTVAALGTGPLQYDVTLELDGVTHRARAERTDDNSPVALSFAPALP